MAKKILIIEDEAKIMRTVRLYLEQGGYETAWAADGAQGLAAFRHEKPALIILDLNLPGDLDGLVQRRIERDGHDFGRFGEGVQGIHRARTSSAVRARSARRANSCIAARDSPRSAALTGAMS